MGKRRNLKGLPHNLIKSYFGTLRYYDKGYMADWLMKAAKKYNVDNAVLDILETTIDPKELALFPLVYHLGELKDIIAKELIANGFETNFIIKAVIKIHIPDRHINTRAFHCCAELTDRDNRVYSSGQITEVAYEDFF